jgi:hypothetical protein
MLRAFLPAMRLDNRLQAGMMAPVFEGRGLRSGGQI